MVDAGEDPDHTAEREFLEEAMNSEEAKAEELEKLKQLVADVFAKGQVVMTVFFHFFFSLWNYNTSSLGVHWLR